MKKTMTPPTFVRDAIEELARLFGSKDTVFELLDGNVLEEEIWAAAPDGRGDYLHGLVNGWAQAVAPDFDAAYALLREESVNGWKAQN